MIAGFILLALWLASALFQIGLSAQAAGRIEWTLGILFGAWALLWLPFRLYEAQQEKHKKELSRLAQEVAAITSAEGNKQEEKNKKDSRGLSLIRLQTLIKRLQNTDPFEYAKELEKDGTHKESNDLIGGIFIELSRDLGVDEAAYFGSATGFAPSQPLGDGALSPTIIGWNWRIQRLVFYAGRLEKIIERHP